MSWSTPHFWYDADRRAARVKATLLIPLAALYRFGRALHQLKTPVTPPVPVVAIGNLNAGGAGKTPAAIALSYLIKDQLADKTPFLVTRGYGGREIGPVIVSDNDAPRFGDEPILLSRAAPTIVSRDRLAGVRLAASEGADLTILDDGLQHPGLEKTVKIVVIDGVYGFGNCRLIPAGPLRQPLKQGLEDADIIILKGEDKAGVMRHIPEGKPVFTAELIPDTANVGAKTSYIAFSGIAFPHKFFATLQQAGVDVVETLRFADHHPFTADDMATLMHRTQARGARLITTEKDFVRLPDAPARDYTDFLPVRLEIEDGAKLVGYIQDLIKARHSG